MFKKIILTFIAVFFLSNNLLKALWALLILAFCLYLQIKVCPFESYELNTMELRSSIVSISTLFFGLLNYLIDNEGTQIILFFIVISVNTYFLFYWGYRMILVNIGKLHLCLKGFIKQFFPNYLNYYKDFFRSSKNNII